MMRITDRGNRGAIWEEFIRVQNGQVVDNLARAFHLPRPKAKAAILEMLDDLHGLLGDQALGRSTLSRLIELIGKNNYEQVLNDATLMGATSTQVIGTEALTALTGHSQSSRMAGRAAEAAEISPMIAEYLLPVVTAIFLGAIMIRTRAALLALARNEDEPTYVADVPAGQLPVGRGSSGLFSGTTVLTPNAGADREVLFRDLAERLRTSEEDATLARARAIINAGLGNQPTHHAPWLAQVQQWTCTSLQNAGNHIQSRLRNLRSR
ncbi:conserved protein of unknown function [Hyphomicrobium sp. 1Nfss2.1]|uniref:hypothetical protein n=1 Tax=Hyphomicrobium sp. 1Nfss2.1 TaxID=3413936 RepID=UPI003C7B7EDF